MGAIRNAWKHWYRRTAVGIAPLAYWRARHALRGFEEPEIALLPSLCRPGTTVVDVGGNFGMYTYWLVRLSARCVVFEPIPALAQALSAGFGERVEVHNVALSAERGSAELVVPRVSPGLSTIEPRNPLGSGRDDLSARLRVETRPLDDFGLSNVSFLKIDVEGHEEAVLRGAQRLLASERPSLLVELEERHNSGCIDRVSTMLRAHGLSGAALHEGRIVGLDEFDAANHQRSVPDTHYVRNFLFARPEIIDGLRALRL